MSCCCSGGLERERIAPLPPHPARSGHAAPSGVQREAAQSNPPPLGVRPPTAAAAVRAASAAAAGAAGGTHLREGGRGEHQALGKHEVAVSHLVQGAQQLAVHGAGHARLRPSTGGA